MNDQLKCNDAIEYIDRRQLLTNEESKELNVHLVSCQSCELLASIDRVIEEVVVPLQIPALPANFESNLMSKLGVIPETVVDPVSKWGWIAGVLTLVTIAYPYLSQIFVSAREYFEIMQANVPQVFNQTGSVTEPFVTNALRLPGQGEALTMSLILGAVVLLGGIITVSIVDRN